MAFFGSNESNGQPFGLTITQKGNATLANRFVSVFTTERNVAAGGNLVLQATAGNVGIGTTGPAYKTTIDLPNGVTDETILSIDNSHASQLSRTKIGYTNSKFSIQSTNIAENTYRDLLLNPSGGNVGIGTTGPDSLLEIEKDQNAVTRIHIDNNTAGTAAVSRLTAEADAGQIDITMHSSLYTTSGQYVADSALIESVSASQLGLSAFGAVPMVFYTNSLERMRIFKRRQRRHRDDESRRYPPCFQRLFVQRSFCRCRRHRLRWQGGYRHHYPRHRPGCDWHRHRHRLLRPDYGGS